MPRGGRVVAIAWIAALAACAVEGPDAGHEAPPHHAHPIFRAGAPPPAKHCSEPPKLLYWGGPVLQNVKVFSVNWGTHITALVTAQMPLFYADVVASPYFDWLSEYDTIGLVGQDGQPGSNQGISRGSFAGSVTIDPSVCAGTGSPGSCVVTDAQVQAELVAQITAGHLPAPTVGCDGLGDTVYMVNFNAAVTISDGASGDSCVDYCAYHGKGSYAGQPFAYAVLPDLSTGGCSGTGCGTGTLLDNTTAVASHELAESVTDPQSPSPGRPDAWVDPTCGEIADICLLLYGTIDPSGTPWTVTQLWSSAENDCITTKASLPPVCTGAGTPPGCRPCSCADDEQGAAGEPGCSGATPWCETDPSNVKQGSCVECTESSECAAPETCRRTAVHATDDTCAGASSADAGLDGSAPEGGEDAATRDTGPAPEAAADGPTPEAGTEASVPEASGGVPEGDSGASLDATGGDASARGGAGSGATGCGCRAAGEAGGTWGQALLALGVVLRRRQRR